LPKLSEPVADKLEPQHYQVNNETFLSLRSLLVALLRQKHAGETLTQVHHDLIEHQHQLGQLAKAEVVFAADDALVTTFVGQVGSLREVGRNYPNHYLLNAHYFAVVDAEFDTPHTVLGDVVGLWAQDGVLATPPLTPRCTLFSTPQDNGQRWHMRPLEVDTLVVRLPDGSTLTNCPETRFLRRVDTADGCTPQDPDVHELVIVGRHVVAIRHGGGGRIPMNGLVIAVSQPPSQARVESFLELAPLHYKLKNTALKQAIQAGPQLISQGSICLSDQSFVAETFLSPDGTHTTIPYEFPADVNTTPAARACLGIDKHGDLLGLVVEGVPTQQPPLNTSSDSQSTGFSEGATLEDAAQLMLELGAVDAMNLDGGGSTQLFAGSGALIRPSDTRGTPFASYDRLIPTAILLS
jgi:hypothetical protein